VASNHEVLGQCLARVTVQALYERNVALNPGGLPVGHVETSLVVDTDRDEKTNIGKKSDMTIM